MSYPTQQPALPVLERIKEARKTAASLAKHADNARLRKSVAAKAQAAANILNEDLSGIVKALERYGDDPNGFIWCALCAYTSEDTLSYLVEVKNEERRLRNRIRKLTSELAALERQAATLNMRGASKEHAAELEAWASRVNVPELSPDHDSAIRNPKPGKAAYLRAFMMLLTEHRVMPHDVLAVRYKEDRLVPNPYDAVIARMASVVLGDEVTITEVRSARKEFGMTIRTWTEPPST